MLGRGAEVSWAGCCGVLGGVNAANYQCRHTHPGRGLHINPLVSDVRVFSPATGAKPSCVVSVSLDRRITCTHVLVMAQWAAGSTYATEYLGRLRWRMPFVYSAPRFVCTPGLALDDLGVYRVFFANTLKQQRSLLYAHRPRVFGHLFTKSTLSGLAILA